MTSMPLQPVPGPSGNDPVRRFAEIDTHGAERCARGAEQVDAAVGQAEFAVGDGRGAGERAELDAIRQDGMHGAGEPRGALDAELMRAEAGHPGAHRDQAGGQVGDLGLARGIADRRRAVGQDGGEQQVFGGADRGQRQQDVGAAQARGRRRLDHAACDRHRRAHGAEAGQVKVDGAPPDGVAAGQRQARLAAARQQRAEQQHRGAHARHQIAVDAAGLDAIGRDRHRQPGRGRRPVHLAAQALQQ